MAEHVDEHVERDVAVPPAQRDVVARVLLAGEGVELAADRVDLVGDVARGRAPLRSLEEHVLREVRDARSSRRVSKREPAASMRKHDDRLRVRHGGGQHAQAVRERRALEDGHGRRWYRELHGPERTRAAIAAQPEWLRGSPTDRRLPDGARVVFTGCGTSFHAAQTGGWAVQALEAVLAPPEADLLVCVSTRATTPLTLEAARRSRGPKWLVTGKADSPARASSPTRSIVCDAGDRGVWCHTASYTCAVAAIAALRGEDVAWLPEAVEEALALLASRAPAHERSSSRAPGRDWPTAQEAVLKLREGAVSRGGPPDRAAPPRLPRRGRRDGPRLRARGRGPRRRAGARRRRRAARRSAATTTLVPTRHPVVDIVRFQLLTLELAEARAASNPDRIRRDDERWERRASTNSL